MKAENLTAFQKLHKKKRYYTKSLVRIMFELPSNLPVMTAQDHMENG